MGHTPDEGIPLRPLLIRAYVLRPYSRYRYDRRHVEFTRVYHYVGGKAIDACSDG